MPSTSFSPSKLLLAAAAVASSSSFQAVHSFTPPSSLAANRNRNRNNRILSSSPPLYSSTADTKPPTTNNDVTYDPPEDAIITIKPAAMARLIELKSKRDTDPKNPIDDPDNTPLILRMGVRNGGCSGLSYVMDFSDADAIEEEDEVDNYEKEGIQCVVDAKSLLYLYGLELDYSDELIGGGFKFFNPNAEESCGCGSSFGV